MIKFKDLARVIILLILFVMTTSVTVLNISQTYVEGKALEKVDRINCLDSARELGTVVCGSKTHHKGKDFCEGDCSYLAENCTLECTGCEARK